MPAKYKITGQVTRPTFDNNSRPIDVIDVFFEITPWGDRSQVSIPVNQYSADAVASAVGDLADKMAAVRELGQG